MKGLHKDVLTRDEECIVHGVFISRSFLSNCWTSCPKCSAEAEAKARAEAERKDREAKRAAWQKRIGSAGIPERFADRSLASYVAETDAQRQALEFATAYADNFDEALRIGQSVLFLGSVGTGKTHLAVGIGLRLMHRDNRSVLFSTVMRAVRRVKDTWGGRSDRGETESQAIAAMVFPDLLILDEVGVQFGSETEKLILFDILNERYEKRRPTLMLSNLSVDGVRDYLGERVFDRMREDGGKVIPFAWESYRGRKVA